MWLEKVNPIESRIPRNVLIKTTWDPRETYAVYRHLQCALLVRQRGVRNKGCSMGVDAHDFPGIHSIAATVT